MALMFTIAQVNQADDGMVIGGITGTLTKLWKHYSGTSQNDKGETLNWSFQNGEIKQGDSIIDIVFNNRDEVSQSFRNKPITLLSTSNDKGLHGVKAKDVAKSKEDKTLKRVVWVTKTAEVVSMGSAESAPKQQPTKSVPEKPRSEPAPQSPAPASQPAAPSKDDEHRAKLDRFIAQLKLVYERCDDAAAATAKTKNWTIERQQSMTSCLYIECCRRNMAALMPLGKKSNS